MEMQRRAGKLLTVIWIVFLSSSCLISAPRNKLTMRFIKAFNLYSKSKLYKKTPSEIQITPLFIRSTPKGSIDLTMLIAYDKNISRLTEQLLDKSVIPLIFSVSTMPFTEINFQPHCLVFEQDGRKWSPINSNSSFDMFPLDESLPFGGQINETQIHQGVVLLPGWFDMSQPIKIAYKNYRKLCHLK
jgi:hypothetical protein